MPFVTNDKALAKVAPLSDESLNHLLSFCELKKFPKKNIIFRETDIANSLYYIVNGSVDVTYMDEEGREIILAYLHKGAFIGEIGLFVQGTHRSAKVMARTECELAEISYEKFDKLVKNELREQYAEILAVVGLQLSERLLKASRRINLLTSMDVAGRVARTLLDLCHEPSAMSHPDGTQIHISRTEIARIVSCSRETVGRVLKKMTEDGIIEVKGMDIVVYHSR